MAGYWGIRTSKEKHDLIGDWLDKGVLRQGWGAHDLRDIGRRASAGQLDEEGRSVWKYTQAMLEIVPGDVVLTPHQPHWNRHGVWRVVEPYSFDPLPDIWGPGEPDFGHVLRVELIGIIDHRSASVSSSLRSALTAGFRRRMRQLHDHAEEIDALLGDPSAGRASDAAEHFAEVRRKVREALGEALLTQYGNADFERPIGALLEALYPEAVKHTAGPAEHGRDFVIEDVDALGLARTIVVQVKSWRGAVDRHHLDHGLAQLERGISAQGGADLAVLLTLADELPPDADKTIALAEQRTGVSTRVLLREETLDLLLERLGSIQL